MSFKKPKSLRLRAAFTFVKKSNQIKSVFIRFIATLKQIELRGPGRSSLVGYLKSFLVVIKHLLFKYKIEISMELPKIAGHENTKSVKSG